MNPYITAELAASHRQELMAQATYHRHTRRHSNRARSHPRRPLAAFHTWLAAGQL